MDSIRKTEIMSLIDEYLLDKALFQNVIECLCEINERMESKDYLVEKRIRDYIFKKSYEKKREDVIRELIKQDIVIKDNFLNDQKMLGNLLQELYQKIVSLVNNLTQEEFIEICDLINAKIESFNYVLMDNPYSDGKRLVPLIGLTEAEKYLIDRQNEYRELLGHLKDVYGSKESKVRTRFDK